MAHYQNFYLINYILKKDMMFLNNVFNVSDYVISFCLSC